MKTFSLIRFLLANAFVAVLFINVTSCTFESNGGSSASISPVYDRVISNGTLRVAYLVLPPYLEKSTSTGELSGVFYDFMEELGKRLQLKVVWVEEANLATLSLGFENNRYDMIAFPLWRSASRAKNVAFSTPVFYSTIGVYVKQDDNRFSSLDQLRRYPELRISTIDGELAEKIAQQDFPSHESVALPQFSDYSQMLLQVATGKADATFFNRLFANRFINKNPGSIKELSREEPIRVFAESFILPLKAPVFKEMIDATIMEMIENGVLDGLLKKHDENPKEYYRTAIPYRTPQ